MKLLFLGDSITDSGHCFDPQNLGEGYVRMINERLSQCNLFQVDKHPIIANKGFDGFTLSRVYRMWQSLSDKVNWDVISILLGVNDVSMWMDCGHSDHWLKSSVTDFERTYEDMISDILDYHYGSLILMEPFIFPFPEKYCIWQSWLHEISCSIRRIAQKYHLIFLPLQEPLTAAAEKEGFSAITLDGIHLPEKGNQILADQWLSVFAK